MRARQVSAAHSAWIWQRTAALQLGRVLSEYFGQQVRPEQFVSCWYHVPAAQQTTSGRQELKLELLAVAS